LEAEQHVTLYFKYSKFIFQSTKKNRNKILEVTNDECYRGVKSQYKLICFLSYTKLTKSEKIYSTEVCTIHYKICQYLLFLCSLESLVIPFVQHPWKL
jgi:hypothetical protein